MECENHNMGRFMPTGFKTNRRLAALLSDGSLTIFAPGMTVEAARKDALDCDRNERNPAEFTQIGYVDIGEFDRLETPSLALSRSASKVREQIAELQTLLSALERGGAAQPSVQPKQNQE